MISRQKPAGQFQNLTKVDLTIIALINQHLGMMAEALRRDLLDAVKQQHLLVLSNCLKEAFQIKDTSLCIKPIIRRGSMGQDGTLLIDILGPQEVREAIVLALRLSGMLITQAAVTSRPPNVIVTGRLRLLDEDSPILADYARARSNHT